ncbi:NADH-quinone oxidoreductase subunit N [Gammaproteobacteria bacterium]|nr:NADH-quinone oxidoreductase subunit N [Gammaproteobacteria bacterium]
MSTDVIIDLMQIILLTVTTVVVMLTAAFKRDHGLINALTLAGLFSALLIFAFVSPVLPLQVTPLLMIDEYSLFFSALIIIGAIAVCALSYPYFESHNEQNEEFYILLLTGTLGAVVLACSNHFVGFFLGMEMLSISLYAMIAYPIHSTKIAKFPLEASLKYLILSGLSSGMMLFGIALAYAQLGTLSFIEMPAAIAALPEGVDAVLLVGILMIVAGVAYKLSLVPFHMWTPDVYEGAPVPVTAYIATVSKAAMLAVTLRLLLNANAFEFEEVAIVLSLMAGASMLIGNVLALLQNNIKRLFAYSSIAHLGYLLVAVIAGAVVANELSIEAMSYYITAYFIMSMGGFAVTSALSNSGKELDTIADYQGLFWRNPWLSTVMITVLFSMAGIPLTAGFIAKFYLFSIGVEGELWILLSTLIIGSSIGLYYYLRLIYTMLQAPAKKLKNDPVAAGLPIGVNAVMLSMTAGIIYLGVYPMPLIESIQSFASTF